MNNKYYFTIVEDFIPSVTKKVPERTTNSHPLTGFVEADLIQKAWPLIEKEALEASKTTPKGKRLKTINIHWGEPITNEYHSAQLVNSNPSPGTPDWGIKEGEPKWFWPITSADMALSEVINSDIDQHLLPIGVTLHDSQKKEIVNWDLRISPYLVVYGTVADKTDQALVNLQTLALSSGYDVVLLDGSGNTPSLHLEDNGSTENTYRAASSLEEINTLLLEVNTILAERLEANNGTLEDGIQSSHHPLLVCVHDYASLQPPLHSLNYRKPPDEGTISAKISENINQIVTLKHEIERSLKQLLFLGPSLGIYIAVSIKENDYGNELREYDYSVLKLSDQTRKYLNNNLSFDFAEGLSVIDEPGCGAFFSDKNSKAQKLKIFSSTSVS